jgi:hypothetical protein
LAGEVCDRASPVFCCETLSLTGFPVEEIALKATFALFIVLRW